VDIFSQIASLRIKIELSSRSVITTVLSFINDLTQDLMTHSSIAPALLQIPLPSRTSVMRNPYCSRESKRAITVPQDNLRKDDIIRTAG